MRMPGMGWRKRRENRFVGFRSSWFSLSSKFNIYFVQFQVINEHIIFPEVMIQHAKVIETNSQKISTKICLDPRSRQVTTIFISEVENQKWAEVLC